jgi:Lrp/AsnC family transcriptional regulator
MDAIDLKILAIIQEDVTPPLADIASRVGLSQTPCWKRIQRLESKGVISKRVAILSPEALGFGLTVYVSIVSGEHSDKWLAKFTEQVTEMPEVIEFFRLAGDVDYMLRVVVTDIAQFDEFYKRLIAIAPLQKVTSHFAMEKIKSTTALPLNINGEKVKKQKKTI